MKKTEKNHDSHPILFERIIKIFLFGDTVPLNTSPMETRKLIRSWVSESNSASLVAKLTTSYPIFFAGKMLKNKNDGVSSTEDRDRNFLIFIVAWKKCANECCLGKNVRIF